MIPAQGWAARFRFRLQPGRPAQHIYEPLIALEVDEDGDLVGWIIDEHGKPRRAWTVNGFDGYELIDGPVVGALPAHQPYNVIGRDGRRHSVQGWAIRSDGTADAIIVPNDEGPVLARSVAFDDGPPAFEPEGGWPES